MNKSSLGFSLIESMIAIVVVTLLTGAVVSILYQNRAAFQHQVEQGRVSGTLRDSVDQISRYLRQAGNDPFGSALTVPVRALGDGYLEINSDLTGNVASATENPSESTGDPDGTLNSIFERVLVRHEPETQTLWIDVGYGEALAARNVARFTFEFYDAEGSLTTDPESAVSISIELVGQTTQPGSPLEVSQTTTLASEVFLRNRGTQFFAGNGFSGLTDLVPGGGTAGGVTSGGTSDGTSDGTSGGGRGKGNGNKRGAN